MPAKTGQWPQHRSKNSFFIGSNQPAGPEAILQHNLAILERHIAAEESNDIDLLMGSIVSENARYVLVNQGNSGPPATVITEQPDVRTYYARSRDSYEIDNSMHILHLATDWYVLHEAAATLRTVGGPDHGKKYLTNAIVLFPVAEKGIIGEIPVGRYNQQELLAGAVKIPKVTSHLPVAEPRNILAHDKFLTCVQTGDINGALALVGDNPRWAVRNYYTEGGPMFVGSTRADVKRHLDAMQRSVDVLGVTILNRIAKEWYVFSENVWRLKHRGALAGIPATGVEFQVRTASVHLMSEDGLLKSDIGYGTDLRSSLEAAIKARG